MPALQTAYGGISAYMRMPERAPRKLFLVLLSALLVLGLVPLASASAASDQVWVVVGQSEAYDGYETNYFQVDGQMAWCSQPEKPSPPGGWTDVSAITDGDSSDQATVMALALVAADELTRWGVENPDDKFGSVPEGTSDALAYSILEALNGPLTMHNTEDSRYARFHVILSYVANEVWPGWCSPIFGAANADEWSEQCEAFYELCRKIVNGDDLSSYGISKADRDSAVQVARSSRIGWTNYGAPGQSLIWLYKLGEAKGWLQVEKKASNERVAGEVGLSPTPAGAKFELYGSDDDGNIDKSDYIATLTTDANGVAQSPWLAPNRWYYVIETAAPEGYALPADEASRTQYTYVYANSDPSACDSRNVLTFTDDPLAGWIQIDKSSANPDCTDGNPAYTLAGAVFGVYSSQADAQADRNRVSTMTTDAKGFAESDWLLAGCDYWVKEVKAPQGFALDLVAHKLTVKGAVSSGKVDYDNGATKLAVAETPVMDPVDIEVKKVDADGNPVPQGTADTLYDAHYEFSFYAGDYSVVSKETAAAKSPTRKCVLRTDDSGYAPLGNANKSFVSKEHGTMPYLVSGDEFYRNARGRIVLPYGTLVIKEVKAPAGYNISDKIFIEQYKPAADGGIELVYPLGSDDFTDGNTWMSYDEVQKGGITFEKRDLESGLTKPLGAGSLDGTKFEIYNKTGKTITVNGKQVADGKLVMSLTPVDGVCSTGDVLPVGDYMVKEVKAGGGYKLTDGTEYSFTVKSAQADTGKTGSSAFKNQVMRGDLELMKFDNDSKKALAGIPFMVTSKTTGESHIIVTDANGYASTAASWNKHSAATNANDAALRPDGTVDESKLDDTAGVWFGEGTSPNDSLGALPYDTYLVEELRVPANAKFSQMFTAEKVMNRDGYTIDLTRVDNENGVDAKPRMSTHLYDAADLDKMVAAESSATVIDEVYYEGLAGGETYKLESSLHDPVTGSILAKPDGTPARWVKEFAPANGNSGYVSATMEVDSRTAKNGIVAYERIVSSDGSVVASETDPENVDQTVFVSFPQVRTKAESQDGGKTVLAREDAVVVDEVSYADVIPGREYMLSATLMDKATGKPVEADGRPVTAKIAFSPIAANGTVEVEISFDALGMDGGAELVVFEQLMLDGAVVAAHEDLADEGQTVSVAAPEIGTTALDASDGDKVLASHGGQAVVDRVSFKNVAPGKKHVLTASLVDKSTGEVLEGTEPVVHEFVPQQREGIEEVRIPVPDGAAAGKELVVFEQLSIGDREIASHKDIEDAGQTVFVEVPGIGTQAADAADGDKLVNSGPAAKIVDKVSYEGLTPGYTYELSATLMDKAAGKPVAIDGRPVTAKKSFNPPASSGTVEVEISFDASALAGCDVVVFEQLALGGEVVAVHEDIDDEDQTVHVAEPEIGTQAADAADGDKAIFAAPGMRITDTVSFKGLTPGYTYKLSATLMDKSTGKPVEAFGRPVAATQTFNPATPDGTVEVEISFDASALAGCDVVVFEQLALGGEVVAVHEDIDDEGQTVHVLKPEIGTQAADAADGDKLIAAASGAKVKDTVSYEGLKPGIAYTVVGKLMDKATGKPVTVEGKEVTASAEFVPVEAAGTVEVVFDFDATQLAGCELVAFEQVFAPWAEAAIAAHEDIDDEGQTVRVEVPGGPLSETGDVLPVASFALAAFAALGALLLARGGMERARRDSEGEGR